MNFYFLNHTNMGKLSTTLAAGAVAVGLSTNPASADTTNLDKQKIEQNIKQQKVEQKLNTVVCKTKVACEMLSESIQTQIQQIEESNDPDYDKLDELAKQLIAVERAETKHNNNLIADENNKQASYAKVNKNMDYIKGSLLSK